MRYGEREEEGEFFHHPHTKLPVCARLCGQRKEEKERRTETRKSEKSGLAHCWFFVQLIFSSYVVGVVS